MRKRAKDFFSQYTMDFWVFELGIIILTAFMYYTNNHYVWTHAALTERNNANIFIIIIGFAALFCVFLLQVNQKHNTSPLAWLSLKAAQKFSSGLSRIQFNNNQANILTMISLLVVFVFYGAYQLLSRQSPFLLSLHLAIIAALLISLYIYIRKSVPERNVYIIISLFLTIPLIINGKLGGFSSRQLPDTYVWTMIGLTLSFCILNRRSSQLFFKLFIVILFLDIIWEMHYSQSIRIVAIIEFVANFLFVGFVIFASMELYLTNSVENYSMMEEVYEELKETQSQLVQREKMVTLGQLIAGVAHEINTPIGAIKGSAEILESSSISILMKLLNATRDYSPENLEDLEIILDLCSVSVKNMRSTTELRRGKAQLRKYLDEIRIPDAGEVSERLARLEICDIEKIENHMDLFRQENILDILSAACILFPFVNSVNGIKFATEKVSKIVFSLKSFSHMNAQGEEGEFDVVKNIDNVLVLYHNQLKTGIEIVKIYEEDIPLVYGNVDEISQVWTNIIQNAIYAMSYVGRLTIRIQRVADEKLEISFTDTGMGISPENMNKIFAPFYTTKPLGEGSGLGLDICKKVLEKHNGDIYAASSPGRGTTFTVTLPVKGGGA